MGKTRRPLAELHVHLNGTIEAARIVALASAAGREVPNGIITEGKFAWSDFPGFIDTMTFVSSFLRTPEDYRAQARSYLEQVAADGGIYVELSVAPTPALRNVGLDIPELFQAVAAGIEDARRATGIEGRIIALPLRHDGPEDAERIAKAIARLGHPLCTGFGLAGNELAYTVEDFTRAFEIAHEADIGCTIHAGEACGAESVAAALRLPVTRIGHGVRSLEDDNVIAELVDRRIVLEVCPSSNLLLGFYPGAQSHPLPELRRRGILCTINSDDPTVFESTLAQEYDLVRSAMGMAEDDLREMTRIAIDAAFVDEGTRSRLIQKAGLAAG